MVDRGFNAYVRDDFTPDGVKEFYRAIREMVFNHPEDHFILVGESNGQIVGMIDVKANHHISMFFVEPSYMGRGIGRGLMSRAVTLCQQERPDLDEMEVHSSPWAVSVYPTHRARAGAVRDSVHQNDQETRAAERLAMC